MMNENDFGSEKVLRAINHLYMMQVCICIAALKELRSAELTDKTSSSGQLCATCPTAASVPISRPKITASIFGLTGPSM